MKKNMNRCLSTAYDSSSYEFGQAYSTTKMVQWVAFCQNWLVIMFESSLWDV